MRWINYQHLYYFWHVAQSGSITEASRQLRLAQPTISSQLRSLEDVLGEKLLERAGRGVRLTESGHLVFRYAEQIFTLGKDLIDVLDGRTAGALREFKIGIADVVPKSLAYQLIEPALRPKAGSVVHCYEDKTERLLAELAIAELDLVIADRPIPPNVKVKAFNHFIGECGVTFVAKPAIARQYRKQFPKSFEGAPLLLPTPESAVRNELNQWFDEVGVTPRCVGLFQDRALMKLAARDGKGIMPVPTAIEADVRREFHLEQVGRVSTVHERIYLISIERKLKHPLLQLICTEGQRTLCGHA